MKFTTLVPIRWNDGSEVKPAVLARIIEALWRPFSGMTNEGIVTGHWVDDDGVHYVDSCIKVSIECDREMLEFAIRAVKRTGRRLGQKAMFFEVDGYDGVQILRIDP